MIAGPNLRDHQEPSKPNDSEPGTDQIDRRTFVNATIGTGIVAVAGVFTWGAITTKHQNNFLKLLKENPIAGNIAYAVDDEIRIISP